MVLGNDFYSRFAPYKSIMFYTKKGDDGKTQVFGCDQKLSKSSLVAEALGTLDELNSFLGVIRSKSKNLKLKEILRQVQENLFVIQAEVSGAKKKMAKGEILKIEEKIDAIEKEIPPIHKFIISGSTEESSLLDYARTLVRKSERRVVAVGDEGKEKIDANTLSYLNRLSSFLFALARHSACKSGINEESPSYK